MEGFSAVTAPARHPIAKSLECSDSMGDETIGTEHLLLSMFWTKGAVGARTADESQCDSDRRVSKRF